MEPGNNQRYLSTPINSQIFLRSSENSSSSNSLEVPAAKSVFELFSFIKQELSTQTSQILERLPDPGLKHQIEFLTETIKSQSESIKANTESIKALEQNQNRECINCKEYQAFLLENMKNRDSIISYTMTEETDLIEKPKLIPESESDADLIGSTTERKNFFVPSRNSMISEFSFQKSLKPGDFQAKSGISNQFLRELNKKNQEIEELKVKIDQFSNENYKIREKYEEAKKFYSSKVKELTEKNRVTLENTIKLIKNIESNSEDCLEVFDSDSPLFFISKTSSQKTDEEIKGEKFKLKKLSDKKEKAFSHQLGPKAGNKEDESMKPAGTVDKHAPGLKPVEKPEAIPSLFDPIEKPSKEPKPVEKSNTCPSGLIPLREPDQITPEIKQKAENDLEPDPYSDQSLTLSPSKCVNFSNRL